MKQSTIVSAGPGWLLLTPGEDDDGNLVEVFAEDIIAWRIKDEAGINVHGKPYDFFDITPVLISGIDFEWPMMAYQSPSGRITLVEVQDFDTREELLAYWQDHQRRLGKEKQNARHTPLKPAI